MLDAVFGADQFRNEVIWKRSSAHSSSKRWSPVHDVSFFYTKTGKYIWNQVHQPLPQETIDAWYNNVEQGTGRRYNRADLTAPGTREGPSGEPWRGIDPTAKGRHWAIPGFVQEVVKGLNTQKALDALDAAGRIHWPKKPTGIPMLKRYLEEAPGLPALDVVTDVGPLNNVAAERLGYPTQKPEALMERIIKASTNPGDVVLDPFCGCGTTITVAHRLDRRWVGIDLTHLAIGLMKHRLKATFGDEIEEEFEVHGEPADVEGARYLAEADRYQFEWWALGLVGARRNEKKGADQGVDGVIWFHDEKGDSRKVVLQVKSGKLGTPALREFRQTVEAQSAAIGAFLALEEPSKPMRAEAADAGTYQSGWGSHPKIQLLTVGQVLDGARINMPPMGPRTTFQRAPRHQPPASDEPSLFDE